MRILFLCVANSARSQMAEGMTSAMLSAKVFVPEHRLGPLHAASADHGRDGRCGHRLLKTSSVELGSRARKHSLTMRGRGEVRE